jgi:hypothetical protein
MIEMKMNVIAVCDKTKTYPAVVTANMGAKSVKNECDALNRMLAVVRPMPSLRRKSPANGTAYR